MPWHITDYRGSSSDRMAEFTYAGLADIFAIENFTAAATADTGSGVSPSGASNPPSGSETNNTSNTGVIVGAVVGGVAGAALIGAVVFLLLRRRGSKRAELQQIKEGTGVGEQTYCGSDGHGALHSEVPRAEMLGQLPPRSEVVGSTPQTGELPAFHRHELS